MRETTRYAMTDDGETVSFEEGGWPARGWRGEERQPRAAGRTLREPPKPPEPTPDDLRRHHADAVRAQAHRHGIPLPNLDSVKAAIRMLDESGSHGAEAETLSQMPDLAQLQYLWANAHREPSRFVDQIFRDLDAVFVKPKTYADPTKRPRYLRTHSSTGESDRFVDRAPYYEGNWDYDGSGAFHKTSLTVQALKGGGFELHVYQSYTGNAAEIDLARKIGARMHFGYCTFVRKWATAGDRIAIPTGFFADVLKALGSTADPAEVCAAFVADQNAHIAGPATEKRGWFVLPGTAVTAYAELKRHSLPSRYERLKSAAEPVVWIEDGTITGAARAHESGRGYATEIEITLWPGDAGPAGEAACVAVLDRLSALYPDLPSDL